MRVPKQGKSRKIGENFLESTAFHIAETEAYSNSDMNYMSETDSDGSASEQLDETAAPDVNANTDTGFQTKLDSLSLFGRNSKRMFYGIQDRFSGDECSVGLTDDWEHISCNYLEYTGMNFWEEVIAFLNAAEPAFRVGCMNKYYDTGEYISVKTPTKSHVQRLKQVLMELEPRYKGYSVPKLTQLIKVNLSEARYSMRAVIEYQGKFGQESALHMLGSYADFMFTRVYLRGYTRGSGTAKICAEDGF